MTCDVPCRLLNVTDQFFQVMQELENYNRNYGGFSSFVRGRRKRSFSFFPWYPSGTDVKQIFKV